MCDVVSRLPSGRFVLVLTQAVQNCKLGDNGGRTAQWTLNSALFFFYPWPVVLKRPQEQACLLLWGRRPSKRIPKITQNPPRCAAFVGRAVKGEPSDSTLRNTRAKVFVQQSESEEDTKAEERGRFF